MQRRDLLAQLGLAGVGCLAAPALAVAGQTPKERDATLASGVAEAGAKARRFRGLGFILVTPDGPKDGGDFGRFTPGTKTAGIQEALDTAKVYTRDVYVAGGAVEKAFEGGAAYVCHETIRVPWMQDFMLEGGESIIVHKSTHGDAVVFDSLMSCRVKLGLVVQHGDGCCVRLHPRTKGPDNFSVITTTKFEINAPVGSGSVWPDGTKGRGYGVILDGSRGSIDSNDIWIMEIVASDVGLLMTEAVSNNYIRVPFLHLCNTHIRMHATSALNRIEATVFSQGIEGSEGVVVSGRRNLLTLNIQESAQGKGIIFAEDAVENLVIVMNLQHGYTNNARVPTNRIVPTYPLGFGIPTPPVPPSGEALLNREPFAAEVVFTSPGQVSEWTRTDADGESVTFEGGVLPGQSFVMQPGESVKLLYTGAPRWRWKVSG